MDLDEITYKTIGCAMKVHSKLGSGFQEVIYQRCLELEFREAGLQYGREIAQPIYYDERTVGERRVDFIIEDNVVLETKACVDLLDVHLAQAKNYLVAYNLQIGLLINFGGTNLQYKKLFNNRFDAERPK